MAAILRHVQPSFRSRFMRVLGVSNALAKRINGRVIRTAIQAAIHVNEIVMVIKKI